MRWLMSISICLVLISSLGFATPEPPKIIDKATYEYVRTLRNNLNRLPVVVSNPSGVRLGDYGDMILYKNGATFSLMINVSSPNGKAWLGVNLGAI